MLLPIFLSRLTGPSEMAGLLSFSRQRSQRYNRRLQERSTEPRAVCAALHTRQLFHVRNSCTHNPYLAPAPQLRPAAFHCSIAQIASSLSRHIGNKL